ncbi:hypothetical protein BAE44_0011113 [Dichanthelium oligosanthes]|uniref:Glycosyl transferase CAP10 domain-containing protein n=1 Tax=Dichanthelium oligosanthes TaxID=888268 RepID=A0A1E5VRX7_9POAL|nr:hypothetical protein BAE44_0011113 [Dichanthelium oligosanthes]
MKSFLFPERERQQQQRDEEEGAVLVPQPPLDADDDNHAGDDERPAAAVKQQLDDDHKTGESRQQQQQQASSKQQQAAAWWRRRAQMVVVPTRSVALVIAGLVVLALLVGSTGSWWMHLDYASSFLLGGGVRRHRRPHHVPSPEADLVPIPFSCGNASSTSTSWTCHRRASAALVQSPSPSPSPSPLKQPRHVHHHHNPPRCPDYFRFIHSDLSPWRETGITREAVESGRGRAAFRLVVVDGRAYVETYHRVFQTRDTFTQWGIAQLLARYPGRVPDLDLMFNCEDMPEVRAADFPARSKAPPLFRYCKDDATLDIVFPDWSFWGWPEVNIRPWAPLLEEMAAEMDRLPWAEREPYAYWKGNPGVTGDRGDLFRCNNDSSRGVEWNARVFAQDWGAAIRDGFRDSNLAKQCRYRYKIFVRGRSWSVSEKYILACDSPVLLLATPFKDFFSRGLVAGRHYWPIDPARKCPAIKFAVDWGNAHQAQARRMAEEGSGFAREDLSMDYVYDYMLHLLTEYASLLRYKPTVPEKAVELCAEAVACPFPAHGRERDFMMQSRERYVADYEPCTLPPPFTADELAGMARREQEVRTKVQKMTDHGGMDGAPP